MRSTTSIAIIGNSTSVGMRVRYALDTELTKLCCTPGGGAVSGIWSNGSVVDILKLSGTFAIPVDSDFRTVDENIEKLKQQNAPGPLQEDSADFLP